MFLDDRSKRISLIRPFLFSLRLRRIIIVILLLYTLYIYIYTIKSYCYVRRAKGVVYINKILLLRNIFLFHLYGVHLNFFSEKKKINNRQYGIFPKVWENLRSASICKRRRRYQWGAFFSTAERVIIIAPIRHHIIWVL